MRLTDADALLPMMKYATTDNEIGVFPIKIGFNEIAKVINDAPTVDAVPVVRCKDCKYSDTFSDMTEEPHSQLKCLGIRYGGVEPMWYCEHGERQWLK